MRLELSHIRQPETEFHKVFQPADLAAGDEEYRVTAPVDLRMVIHKDQDRFRLVGTVKTELELDCSRCLEPFRVAGRSRIRFAVPARRGGGTRDGRRMKRSRSKTTTSR